MKIYLSGEISGDPDYRDKFAKVARRLEAQGHVVLNPAVLPEGLAEEEALLVRFAMIDVAECVAILPKREKSTCTLLELAHCCYTDKQKMYLREDGRVGDGGQ